MEHIDLHMHSLYSDGTDTPDELVRRAKEAGLGMIALTDHNTLDGIPDFREACARYHMAGIDGVELSTGWERNPAPDSTGREPVPATGTTGLEPVPGVNSSENLSAEVPVHSGNPISPKPGFPEKEPPEIHILGYFPKDFDLSAPSFKALRKVVEDYHLLKIRHNEDIVQRIADAAPGADRVSVDGFHAFARTQSDSGNYNRVHIARYLVQTGTASSVDDAFGRFIGKDCPYYVPKRNVTMQEAIAAIHAARGTAVVAHVGEYHFDRERLRAFFDDSMAWGIDGYELLHPHNTPETAQAILAFAERFRRTTGRDLLLTAGSDYHGRNKKNRQGLPWHPDYAWD